MILPLPMDDCQEVVESLQLPYPLFANPDWSVFEAYGTGHLIHAPKQAWIGIDPEGLVRYTWFLGTVGRIGRVPLALEALDQFDEASG